MPAPMDPKKKKQMIQLYEAGEPLKDIGKKIGMSKGAVSMALQRARERGEVGVRPQGKGPKPKPPDKAVYKQNRTVIFLDDETHKLLKMAAVIQGESMSAIAAEALKKHLKGLKDKMPLFFGKE